MRQYKLICSEDATDDLVGVDEWKPYEDEGDIRYAVYECVDDIPIRFLGCDGGEPEDQTLWRDWKWVVDELNRAYKAGREDTEDSLCVV